LRPTRALDDPIASEMNILALSRQGTPVAGSTREIRTSIYFEEGMAIFGERQRTAVPLLHGLAELERTTTARRSSLAVLVLRISS